jgi:hypothetical protein
MMILVECHGRFLIYDEFDRTPLISIISGPVHDKSDKTS